MNYSSKGKIEEVGQPHITKSNIFSILVNDFYFKIITYIIYAYVYNICIKQYY